MTQPTDRPGIDQLRNLADRAERHQLTGDEATRLRDGIGRLDARIDYLAGYAATLETYAAEQREHAEAILTAVRKLHKRWDADPASCAHCVDGYGTPVRYPCPTITVLDQHGQTTA